jgi:PIN domain nuclease of toxin-antitoxin system
MNYLLDTHTFLWTLFSPEELSKPAAQEIMSPLHDISISVVTLWEISLKYAIGKLELQGVEPEELPESAEKTGMDIIPLSAMEAAGFHKLPRLRHKDPFDRLLIWQAIQRDMILISKDHEFDKYRKLGLKRLW